MPRSLARILYLNLFSVADLMYTILNQNKENIENKCRDVYRFLVHAYFDIIVVSL